MAEQELLPDKHLVDAGYIDAQLLVDSKNHVATEASQKPDCSILLPQQLSILQQI